MRHKGTRRRRLDAGMSAPDRDLSVSNRLPSVSSSLPCVSSRFSRVSSRFPCVSSRFSRVSSRLARVSTALRRVSSRRRCVSTRPPGVSSRRTGAAGTERSVSSGDSRVSPAFLPAASSGSPRFAGSKLTESRSDPGGKGGIAFWVDDISRKQRRATPHPARCSARCKTPRRGSSHGFLQQPG